MDNTQKSLKNNRSDEFNSSLPYNNVPKRPRKGEPMDSDLSLIPNFELLPPSQAEILEKKMRCKTI
jgi:hypothetical protein